MSFDAATLLRALVVTAIASCLAAGCTNTVTTFDDDDGDACGDPPPSDGWCPPAWTCIDGEWVDTAGACPDPCPAERPSEDGACAAEGVICSYESFEEWGCDEGEWVTTEVACHGGTWTTLSSYCQPEPVCPDEPPVDGSDCSGWYDAYWCGYPVETSCGSNYIDAYCDFGQPTPTWVATLVDECPEGCGGHGDPASCEANSACRWLEPGCSDGALAAAGCFPAEPCAADGCAEGESCEPVTVDPCWNSSCDACSAETTVCQPL